MLAVRKRRLLPRQEFVKIDNRGKVVLTESAKHFVVQELNGQIKQKIQGLGLFSGFGHFLHRFFFRICHH